MKPALEEQISRLNRRQKLALADRLLADAGVHARPPSIHSADDSNLETELRRRLNDKRPGAWLTLSQFRARTGLR